MKKEKKKLSKSAIIVIVGLCIIAVPVIVFAVILISAWMTSGKPVTGNRYNGDLDPAITSTQTSAIISQVEAISEVEKCEIELITSQYRINVDLSDDITVAEAKEIVNDIYEIVDETLPIETYFTVDSSKKMYDLTINAYNFVDGEDENMIYYILTKNSKMEEAGIQLVSEPLDAELAKELRGETETEESDSE